MWINDWMQIEIKWEIFTVKMKTKKIMHLINEKITYIIDNIAQLLSLNPKFSDNIVSKKVQNILDNDKTLIENRRKNIWAKKDWEKFFWEENTYFLKNWAIWYSYWNSINKEYEWYINIIPSANFITKDVLNFKPIDKRFSKDSENVYWTYHKVWDYFDNSIKPDIKTFIPEKCTLYWSDDKYLYHTFNLVKWADISWKIRMVSNKYSVIVDTKGQVFHAHNLIKDIQNPEKLAHVGSWFLYDWNCIYLCYWMTIYNITKLCSLNKWTLITRLWKNEFKIWKISFTWDWTTKYEKLLDLLKLLWMKK